MTLLDCNTCYCTQVGIVLGLLSAYGLGIFFKWRALAMIATAISAVGLLALIFVPESPSWDRQKGRLEVLALTLAYG